MQFDVAQSGKVEVVVDLGDNLEQPDSQQWKIVLRKPAKYKTRMTTMVVGGEVVSRFDTGDFIDGYVVRHINAPDIAVDGGKGRKLRTADLFSFETFEPVVEQLTEVINEMNSGEETDPKN